MYGLQGLAQSPDKREAAVQQLSVLERMDQRVNQDKAASVEAQRMQEESFQKIYEESRGMLEKDRNRINNRAKIMQSELRDQMAKYGGSKADFMANGGASYTNKIKNGILESEEAQRYRQNSENLAKIRMAQEKGLGHLISPTDLKSVEDYYNLDDGSEISYKGMMAEVEIPPSELFDYGTEMPIENILTHKSNMMKVRANYGITYPDRPEPTWEQLVQFGKKMGYGGLGSNTAKIKAAATEAAAKAKYAKESDPKRKSYLNMYNTFVAGVDRDINVSRINQPSSEGGYDGKLIENLKRTNKAAAVMIKDKFTAKSKDSDWIDDEWLGLKEGYHVFPGHENEIVSSVLPGFEIKNGMVMGFAPTEDMYREDGVKVTGNNSIDPEDYRGNFKILGVSTALESYMDSDETDALLMDRYESDGKIDKKSNAKMEAGYTNNVKMATVIALQDEDGEIFYKKVDIADPMMQTKLSQLMPADDITETVQMQNEGLQLINSAKNLETEQQVQFESAKNMLETKVFNNDAFKGEGEEYFGANSAGQSNRYDMMKSFYMAFDHLSGGDGNVDPTRVQKSVDNNIFSVAAAQGGINELLKKYEQGNSPETIIASWLDTMNSDQEEGSLGYKRNLELAQKWKQILGIL